MYAARLLRSATQANVADVAVVATRPSFSVEGIDAIVPVPIHWCENDRATSWDRLGLHPPKLVFVSGWAFPVCSALAGETVLAGGKAVVMSDNRWRGGMRQQFGRVFYRLFYRRRFSAAWVPGQSAAKAMRNFGVPPAAIYEKLYGCDPELFGSVTPLDRRERRIVFVGQMILRKGIDALIEGFVKSGLVREGWSLNMFGSGASSRLATDSPGVTHHEFSGPEVVSSAVRSARIFALPSRDDNWPLALHEGASAGCQLLTTTAVGSSDELVRDENGAVVRPGDPDALAQSLRRLATADDQALRIAEATSKRLAAAYGPGPFSDTFRRICQDLI
jgi:glycosyltransferase involved in cell wall biosynthesis